MNPEFAEAYNNRGYAHSLTGYSMDFSNAIKDWDKAEKLGLKPKKKSIYKTIKTDNHFDDFVESLWTVTPANNVDTPGNNQKGEK